MVHVHIEVPRPYTTFALFVLVVSLFTFNGVGGGGGGAPAQPTTAFHNGASQEEELQQDARGGSDVVAQVNVYELEDKAKRAKVEQEVIERREEILRYQLNALEERRRLLNEEITPGLLEEFREAVSNLVALIQNKRRAEEQLRTALREIWASQESARSLSLTTTPSSGINIVWPVEPDHGISAGFLDTEYEKIFGMQHRAIDIPVLQGSIIAAAEDGVVDRVVDAGHGYSWISMRHNGFVTVYGHVSGALVTEGQHVWQGDPIARSGGMPGQPGSGYFSTGPHLHFEVITRSGHIDPAEYLPEVAMNE